MLTAIFFIGAFLAVLGGVGIVVFRTPVLSVLSLVLTMLALAVEFLILGAQFLFAVQIIVYAGAVMVLFLFVVALVGPVREAFRERLRFQPWLALVFALAFVVLLGSLLGSGVHFRTPDSCVDLNFFGTVESIATGLFTTYLYPFELTSILLLVAAVGAIYLSRSERP